MTDTKMDTSAYYRDHAQAFFDRTAYEPVDHLYATFLPLLPPGAHIFDAGCGSGRDTKNFLARGYQVTAMDASPEMAALAEQFTGQPVRVLRFQDVDYVDCFDGIWASASLLHVPLAEMPQVFERCIQALKPNGVWHMSFKYGDGAKRRGERMFTDFNEQSLPAFIAKFDALKLLDLQVSGDSRYPHDERVLWVSAQVRRI